ncbi:uncharacterized protein METZ01_LOCUS11911 [marine metagenome]|uniref:Uncharacterized protein n=1 Tax=marine metagenome TaxID=408172 RepID=A0A381NX96_9ZZZZ
MRNKLQEAGFACYALARRTGFMSTRVGQGLFTSAYFLYKRHIEAPCFTVIRRLDD